MPSVRAVFWIAVEKIKVHGNLIKRCVKNGPIRIYKHKTIRELEKSIPCIFKLLRINKNKP